MKYELFHNGVPMSKISPTKHNGNIFSKLSALMIFAVTHKLMFPRLFCLIPITFKEKFESLPTF